MADFKFEGDLSQITEPQLKYIKSVIEQRGYKNNKIVIGPVGKAGDNYGATVKRITIDDGKGGSFKMVAKIAPENEILRTMTNTEFLFRNEHIMYTKVLPKFTQLEIAAGVPPKERLRYAGCYGSSGAAPNEVILLEDLNECSFTMLDRFQPLSSDCVKSVLKSFALLHSLSYVLKYKEPELFEEFKDSLYDTWGQTDKREETIAGLKQMEANACSVVENDVYRKAISGSILEAMKTLSKMSKYEKDSKHAIIQQGDSWNNNIMFKFDGEILLECIMIDYQISKAASPVADILYMIFNCTDYESRKQNFYDWIDYYHNELDKSLSNYGLKANLVFPRDQLDVDLKRYGKISFGISVLLASVLTLNSEDASAVVNAMDSADVDGMMEGFSAGSRNPETMFIIKKRLENLVDSCHEFGLI